MKWANENDVGTGHQVHPKSGNGSIVVTAAILFILIFASMNEQWIVHKIGIALRDWGAFPS